MEIKAKNDLHLLCFGCYNLLQLAGCSVRLDVTAEKFVLSGLFLSAKWCEFDYSQPVEPSDLW